jgi:hypothetical protein
MKPSLVLMRRLAFTTKEVGRGFYRGTRTGSMGAHTEYGGYILDYRKVRNYVVPEIVDFNVRLPDILDFMYMLTLQVNAICHSRNGTNAP